MKQYKQVTKDQRQEIAILRNKGYKQKEIAKVVELSESTISRELNRNSVVVNKKGPKPVGVRSYIPNKADNKRRHRRRMCKTQFKKIITNGKLRDFIEENIQKYWSPEQIGERWNKENEDVKISFVTIYKFMYSAQGQKFHGFLYSKRYKPKKRRLNATKREMITNRTWIEDRPQSINERKYFGDFEGDLIVSKKGEKSSLLTVIDRKTRLLFAQPLENRKPKLVTQRFKKISQQVKIKSITLDNGIEFKDHENFGCKTYFCHPYSSWEKGQIEYANRMIRQFIPKRSIISDFSDQQIQDIVYLINSTPRKCLDYQTPFEAYTQELSL